MADKLRCEMVSHDTVYDLAHALAGSVRASGYAPDLVVAISRGGFTPARVLCDVLSIFNLTSIRVVHYRKAAAKEQAAYVEYPICIPVAGLQVLVVDDVNDSGDTLRVARAHLDSLGPAEVRTAVLHEKTSSPIRADYAAATITEWRWLIYPWAVVEDVGGFLRQMSPLPGDVAEAAERLHADYDLQMPANQLQRLLQLIQDASHHE
jgi:hypoxanthine phosphoribosyltransferase